MKRYLHKWRSQLSPAKRAEKPTPLTIGGLLLAAWRTVWPNRSLWWLGIIAGIGQVLVLDRQSTSRFLDPQGQAVLDPLLLSVLLLGFMLWLSSLVAEAGLIRVVYPIKRGQRPGFREGWQEGRIFLLPLIKVNLLLIFISLTVALLLGWPAVQLIKASPSIGLVTGGIGLGLFFVYCLILVLLYPWIIRYVVLGSLGSFPAIASSWQLFLRLPRMVFSVGLVGLIIRLTALFALLLILAALLPFIMYLGNLLDYYWIFVVFLGISVIVFFGLVLFALGIMTALHNVYFTLAFGETVNLSPHN
jgi:hypothetical protein